MIRRNTIQKELVLDTVRSLKGHVTADEVYNYIAEKHPSIGRGTVYRNLNNLCEEGQVRRVEISNAPDIFDFSLHEHYHIKCLKCGKVSDVDMSAIEDMTARINDTHGFEFISFDILFKGICSDCNI